MKAALIADDLTGANNAAVLVAKRAFTTMTVSYRRPMFAPRCDVLCIDTDSRYAAAATARRRVREMTAWVAAQGAGIICKRVDNLLRENIGAEIGAVLDHLGDAAAAVVSPAFPALGRRVSDGHLIVNGVPVHEHPVAARDPFAPVRDSRIAAIIGPHSSAEVAEICKREVRFDVDSLSERLQGAISAGSRVVVVDQEDEADTAALAEAMARMDAVLVPVDPGPLSARYLEAARSRLAGGSPDRVVLAAVASVTPVTRAQLRYLLNRRGLEPVDLDPRSLIGSAGARDAAIGTAVARTVAAMASSSVAVLTTCLPDQEPLDLAALAGRLKWTPHALSKRISDALADAVVRTIEASAGRIASCYLSGGDLLASVFQTADARAFRILGDVIPLSAHAAFAGGRLDGLELVTKGGSIGEEDAMDRCIRLLERRTGADLAATA